MRELIIGGQKSGKSRAAECRATQWLAIPGREAVLIATAEAGDPEMAQRIARHRADRRERCAALQTVEAATPLPAVIARWSLPARLVIVDCLTLWLTQLAMPLAGAPATDQELRAAIEAVVTAAAAAPGPLVFVSNEIGLGASSLSAEARRFVDRLGLLHQAIAGVCDRVTLMVAGCELAVRRQAV